MKLSKVETHSTGDDGVYKTIYRVSLVYVRIDNPHKDPHFDDLVFHTYTSVIIYDGQNFTMVECENDDYLFSKITRN